MTSTIRKVGSQDPDRKNSPIAWETDEDTEALRESLPGEPVCFFNDTEFGDGVIVESSDVELRCERGIWVPVGPAKTGRP
jgi:hypothetical protein